MELQLKRNLFLETRTAGELFFENQYFCFTEEDKVREVKVPKETAIPEGRYQLVLETSARFGPETPTVLQVPGFSGIRIHAGNTEADTDGCILLGYTLNKDGTILNSRLAVEAFRRKLKEVLAVEEAFLTISHTTR